MDLGPPEKRGARGPGERVKGVKIDICFKTNMNMKEILDIVCFKSH